MAGTSSIDETAIQTYLAEDLGEADQFAVAPLEGGNANETLLVTWGERELVLRRPPLAEPAPGILHGLLREYEVLDALAETWVPTPSVLLACEDETVIGDVFYVMEYLAGDVIADEPPSRFKDPTARHRIGSEAIDTLAKLHHIDVDRVGLADFGDPNDYTRHQVEQLTEQLEWATERTETARELPVVWEIADWLAAEAPETVHHTLVHGDYKPDNLLFAPGTPARIAGVLDWEMATLGDPLADLGWLLSYWADERDPSPVTDDIEAQFGDHDFFPMLDIYAEDYSMFMRHPEFHSRQELVTRYEAQTGIEYTNDRFYRTLAVFKLAVLCEGFFRMYLEDSPSAKESYPLMELMVPTLGRQARQIRDGDTPL